MYGMYGMSAMEAWAGKGMGAVWPQWPPGMDGMAAMEAWAGKGMPGMEAQAVDWFSPGKGKGKGKGVKVMRLPASTKGALIVEVERQSMRSARLPCLILKCRN